MYIVQCDDLLAAQVRGPNPGTWRSRRSTTAEQLPRNQWGGRVFGNFCDSQYILTTEFENGFNSDIFQADSVPMESLSLYSGAGRGGGASGASIYPPGQHLVSFSDPCFGVFVQSHLVSVSLSASPPTPPPWNHC